MIGLRQDPLLREERKKERRIYPLVGSSVDVGTGRRDAQHGESPERASNAGAEPVHCTDDMPTNTIEEVDDDESQGPATKDETAPKNGTAGILPNGKGDDDAADATERRRANDGGAAGCAKTRTKDATSSSSSSTQRHQPGHPATRIKLESDGSWKSLLRDVATIFAPLIVMFIIVSHPLVANVGYQDPNAPRKLTQEEIFEQLVFSLAVKKKMNEVRFLEAMNDGTCYDFPHMELTRKKKRRRRFDRYKGRDWSPPPRAQGAAKSGQKGQRGRSVAGGRSHSSPSKPPIMASVFGSKPPAVHKGSELATDQTSGAAEEGQEKKYGGGRARRVKFGSRR